MIISRKGVVMIVTMLVISVLLVLTGAYFFSILSEKQGADSEKGVMQALGLSEAGAAHARAELRQRIRVDLNARIAHVAMATIQPYATGNDPLGFLGNYGYAVGDPQFSIAGGIASLAVSPVSGVLNNTTIAGNYSATIYIQPAAAPSYDNVKPEAMFHYQYWINSTGSATGLTAAQRRVRLANGFFNLTVGKSSFSKYALFTFHHSSPSGGVVWFTGSTNFTGPVHTNERFAFANNLSAHFTEDVTQFNNTSRFYNNGNDVLLAANSNAPRDVPVFDKTFTRNATYVTLNTTTTQADVKAQALGTLAEPGTSGIYVPNNAGSLTGGIFVRGNCNITTSVGAGDSAVYNISQGAAYKVITVNYATGATSVNINGSNITNYTGIPDGVSHEGIIIYTHDNITSFGGTVQHSSAVAINTEQDLVITSNVTYEQYNPGPPYNATGYDNILSMLSWGGDVRIGAAAPNNVTIHGVLMAPNGVFTVDNYDQGVERGIATLFGGVITDHYGAFGQFSGTTMTHGYGRNFVYDDRMLAGMSPPYFPYTNTTQATVGRDANSSMEDLDRDLTWQDLGA